MIDADRTLTVLGVDVSTLTPGSQKKVFAVCEECGEYRLVDYCYAIVKHLCRGCAHIGKLKKDISGKRFGRLVVLKEGKRSSDGRITWECICDCGAKKTIRSHDLISGKTKSCGCLHDQQAYINGKRLAEKQKGINHPFYGRELSEEHRSHISSGRIESKCAQGRNNPSWKGGIASWRSRMWRSMAYQAWRKAVFERDRFTCQICGDDTGHNLQAHHIRPVREHKNDLLILDVNNGITLCKECHKPTIRRESEFEGFFYAIISTKETM